MGPGILRGGAGDGGAKTTLGGISSVGRSVGFSNVSPMLLIASACASPRAELTDSFWDPTSAPDSVFSVIGAGRVSPPGFGLLPMDTKWTLERGPPPSSSSLACLPRQRRAFGAGGGFLCGGEILTIG